MRIRCKISARARLAMQNELRRFPETETGGLLLGYADEQRVYVLEATDSGYREAVHEQDCFAYDAEYEEHLCGVLSELYEPPLDVIGVWHKHNFAANVPFSRADETIHAQLLQSGGARLSILFEKEEDDEPRYRARVFLLSRSGDHFELTDRAAWSGLGLRKRLRTVN